MKAWHARYAEHGLRVIGVHASGFEASKDPDEVSAAMKRLDVPYPVVVDTELEIWQFYGNLGWPARYLWTPGGTLFDYHYGGGPTRTRSSRSRTCSSSRRRRSHRFAPRTIRTRS